MVSVIFLELDTTAPILKIFAPNYTTRSSNTPILVESNEPIANEQEIYIIDSQGKKHDLTFTHNGDTLHGELSFSGYPLGIATLNIRLMDSVYNKSDIYSHSFAIIESEVLIMKLSNDCMSHSSDTQVMKHSVELVVKK